MYSWDILTKPLFEPIFLNVKAENYMLAHILFLKGTVLNIAKYVCPCPILFYVDLKVSKSF